LAVGVVENSSSSPSQSFTLDFVFTGFSEVLIAIPAITHFFPSESKPESTCVFFEKPMSD
jgi:hypothetical protein